jgi:formate dehydrogenase major subunit
VAPLFAGISHERLDRDGALPWPCRSVHDPGEALLYLDRFETDSGRARLAAVDWLPPGEQPDSAYPYILITGRRLAHYNAGTMTRRTSNLDLVPEEMLDLHPDDLARLGLVDGDRVAVSSRRGEIVTRARGTDAIAPGQAFLDFHFPEVAANALTSDVVDTVTSCPEYKVTAVSIRPVSVARAEG